MNDTGNSDTETGANAEVSAPELSPARQLAIQRVGNIAIDTGGATYSGCMVKLFADDDLGTACDHINSFFTVHGNLMIVAMQLSGSEILVTYTKTLTDEELELVQVRGNIIEEQLQKYKAEKRAEVEAEEARINAEHERLTKYATIGEHCEKNHGAVVKQLRAKTKGKN